MAYRRKFGMWPILLIGLLLLWIRSRSQTMTNPKEMITSTLTSSGINEQTARFWVAVSAHETGGWTSAIFKENNNLFGMRLPSRNTLAVGVNRGHAVFPSILDSAKDLVLYFDRLNWAQRNFNTIPELVAYMKSKNYFTANESEYRAGVERWYKKIYG